MEVVHRKVKALPQQARCERATKIAETNETVTQAPPPVHMLRHMVRRWAASASAARAHPREVVDHIALERAVGLRDAVDLHCSPRGQAIRQALKTRAGRDIHRADRDYAVGPVYLVHEGRRSGGG